MKWIAISGSWRKINKDIEVKVRSKVRSIIENGDGIVTGGALGVDSIAADEALKYNPDAKKIKIFLPTTLEKYAEHYVKHSQLGTITKEQADYLISQLTNLHNLNSDSIIENEDVEFNEETKKKMYYDRNSDIVNAANELIAFRVKTSESEGLGTADTVNKAKMKGIPVELFEYSL